MLSHLLIVVVLLAHVNVAYCSRCSYVSLYLWSYRVKCSSLQLNEVPKDLEKSEEIGMLDLRWNNITEIHPDDFKGFDALTTLSLQYNPVRKIPSHVFASLTRLEHLYVTADVIEDGAFLGLPNLERLVIYGSKNLRMISKSIFKSIPSLKTVGIIDSGLTKIKTRLFSGFNNLRTVYLQRNEITELEKGIFAGSIYVEEILLHGNHLSYISQRFFQDLPFLRLVKLSDNQIKIIDKKAFSSLHELETLDLSGNLLSTIPAFEDIRLRSLNLSNNYLKDLPFNVSKYPNLHDFYSTMTHLDVSNNLLESFSTKILSGLNSLQVLRLQNNTLKNIYIFNPVRDLDVSFNCFKSRPQLSCFQKCYMRYCCLKQLPSIRETSIHYGETNLVDLKGNNLTEVTFSGDDTFLHYMDLNLSNCNIRKVMFLPSKHGNRQSLLTLDLSNNFITDVSWDFSESVSIRDLSVKNNVIARIGKIKGAVKSIDLSKNKIKSIGKEAFNSTVLDKLYLNDNSISTFHNETIESIGRLKILNLSGNALLEFAITKTDSILEWLDLSRNKLLKIPNQLNRLFALKYLDLSNNNISNMVGNELNELDHLKVLKIRNNDFSSIEYTLFQSNKALNNFDISKNHLKCDCDLTLTLNKIKNKDLKIAGHCKANSTTILSLQSLIKPVEELSRSNCNLCLFSPCKHRGQCVPNKQMGFQCICDPPYTGRNCQVNTLECFKSQSCGLCNSTTCGNHGECEEVSKTEFRCKCSDGYTGRMCENVIEPCYKSNFCGVCNSTTCKNNGTCVETSVENAIIAHCHCLKYYSGRFCEHDNQCISNTSCHGNGVCIRENERSVCKCKPEYAGNFCETHLPYCQFTQSCGICIGNVCKNNGKCIEITNKDFYCACTGEYIGKHCEINSSSLENEKGFSKNFSVSDLIIILVALVGVVALTCYLANSNHQGIAPMEGSTMN